jgi:hypothetical protein
MIDWINQGNVLLDASAIRKVDWTLDLSECLKKMVDDKRGPCGCDKVNRGVDGCLRQCRGPLKSISNA